MGCENRDNRARYLVLDREDVVQLAVVALGPAVCPGDGIDELRRDADPIADPPNASFQHVACAQLAPDLPDIDGLALVLEGGIARDDQKLGEPRQLGCNVLGYAVAEVILLRVAVEVGEWEDRDGRPIVHLALLPSPNRSPLLPTS